MFGSLLSVPVTYSSDEGEEIESENTSIAETGYSQQSWRDIGTNIGDTVPTPIITKHESLDTFIVRPVRNMAEAEAAGVPDRVPKQVVTRYMNNDEHLSIETQEFNVCWVGYKDKRYFKDEDWPHNSSLLSKFDHYGTDTETPKRQFFDRHSGQLFWATIVKSKPSHGRTRNRRTKTLRVQHKRPGSKSKITSTLGRKASGSKNACTDPSHHDDTVPCVLICADSCPPLMKLVQLRAGGSRSRRNARRVMMIGNQNGSQSSSTIVSTSEVSTAAVVMTPPPRIQDSQAVSLAPQSPLIRSPVSSMSPPPSLISDHSTPPAETYRRSNNNNEGSTLNRRRSLSVSQETDTLLSSPISVSSSDSLLSNSLIQNIDESGKRAGLLHDIIQLLSEFSQMRDVPVPFKRRASRLRSETSKFAHEYQFGGSMVMTNTINGDNNYNNINNDEAGSCLLNSDTSSSGLCDHILDDDTITGCLAVNFMSDEFTYNNPLKDDSDHFHLPAQIPGFCDNFI